jgi:hypothetical protein
VAHVGEETGLGLHRVLGREAGAFQQLGDAFLVGDVGNHGGDTGQRAVFGQQGCLGHDDVVGRAVARVHRGLVTQRTARAEQFVVGLAVAARCHAVADFVQTLAHDIMAGDADHLFPRRVDQRDAPLGVADDHRQRQRLEQCLHDPQGVAERAFHLLALGDVGVSAGHARRAAIGIARGHAAIGVDPHPAAVGMFQAVVHLRKRRAALQRIARGDAEGLAVVRVYELLEVLEGPDVRVVAEAEELAEGTVDEDPVVRDIPIPQA